MPSLKKSIAPAPWPRGRITFLYTDIQGSSRMSRALGNARYVAEMRTPHDAILEDAVAAHGGRTFANKGDGIIAVFGNAGQAVACAEAVQKRLAEERRGGRLVAADGEGRTWEIHVRMGLHTSRADLEPPGYGQDDLNFAARIESLADGGQVVVSQTTFEASDRGAGRRWQAWPNRRLKSFEDAPETVHELLYDGWTSREPGLRWFPAWFRGERNPYVSRAGKEAEVFAHFADARDAAGLRPVPPRIVTLKAGGGMGKTRLALHCGILMAGRFPDGVFFVSLADRAADPAAVAEAICAAMEIPPVRPDDLPALLRDRETLLILDNYESVAGDAVAAFLADLAADTNALRLLVTGRESVKAWDVEQLVALDEGMTKREARELFIARARLRRREGPAWNPSPAEEGQIARILALTERIPLALELAAAWMETESPRQIADGLHETPLGEFAALPEGFVRSDDRETRGRQRSLIRSLDWSYNLLVRESEETAHGFAALSVFADTFTPETVAAVCTPPDARALLRRLHHASLVRLSLESGRYRLHRFTRAYAAARLEPLSTALPVKQRFVAACVRILMANQNLNDAKVRATLTAEWRNVLAAAETAKALEDWQLIVSLSDLGNFLNLRGMWSEEERLYLRALAAARTSGNRRGEGHALNNLGNAYQNQGNWSEAEKVYQESLVIKREVGDHVGEWKSLTCLGNIYNMRGANDEAIGLHQQARKICRDLGDRRGEGQTLNNIGNVYLSQGKWDEAEKAYQQDVEICRDLGDRHGESQAINNLGVVYENRGEWSEAEEVYQQSLVICGDLGDRYGEGVVLTNLALLMAAQEKPAEALGYARAAVAILETTEDAAMLAQARALVAKLSGGGAGQS